MMSRLRVLLIYQALIPSVRLCGHCQLEELQRRGTVDYRAVQTADVTDELLSWADVVVLGRLDSWYEARLAAAVSRSGRTLLYILDDDLLNVPRSLTTGGHYIQPQIQKNIRTMLRLSDGLLSPSPLLLQKYAVGKTKPVLMMEPALDPAPFRPHGENGPVKIGFAGSLDRAEDIEQILGDALLRLRETYGQKVRFAFYGPRPSFAGKLEAECIPYSDSYEAYRRTINALDWDIGLAPMPDSPFHACKHYNKFVEYAAAGIGGVYSDVQPYTRLREELGAGVFCDNTADSWYEALSRLVEDGQAREALRAEAADRARALNVSAAADLLLQALEEQKPGEHPGIRAVRLYKPVNLVVRAVQFIGRNGLRAPAAALQKLRARNKNR